MDNDPNNNWSIDNNINNQPPDPIGNNVPTNSQPQPVVESVFQPIAQPEPVANNQPLPADNLSQPNDPTAFNQVPVQSAPYIEPSRPKNSKKTFLVIGAVILSVLILAVVAFFLIKSSSGGKLGNTPSVEVINSIFDPNRPIVIKQEMAESIKFGVIDIEGNTIIEPKYDKISDYYGDYAIAENWAYREDSPLRYYVIDRKGKIKIESDRSIYRSICYDRWVIDGELLDGNFNKVYSNDKIGIGDHLGGGYFTWGHLEDNKEGFINSDGKITFTSIYEPGVSSSTYSSGPFGGLYREEIVNGVEVCGAIEDGPYTTMHRETYNSDYSIKSKEGSIINLSNNKVVLKESLKVIDDSFQGIGQIDYAGNNIFYIRDKESITGLYIKDDKVAYRVDDINNIEPYYYNGKQYLVISYPDYEKGYKWYDIEEAKLVEGELVKAEDRHSYQLASKRETFRCSGGNTSSVTYGLKEAGETKLPCDYREVSLVGINSYTYLNNKIGKKLAVVKYSDKYDEAEVVDLDTKEAYLTVKSNSYSSITVDDYTIFLTSNFRTYNGDVATDSNYIYNLVNGKNLDVGSNIPTKLSTNYFIVPSDDGSESVYYNHELKEIYRIKNLNSQNQ